MSCHSCRLNHVVSIVSCRVINLYFILTYFNRSGGSTRSCRVWIFVHVVASMVSYCFFSDKRLDRVKYFGLTCKKNNTFRWFLNKIRRGFRRQHSPKILSCVLQYVFLLFQVSLGALVKKPLPGSLVHRFSWSFRKFIIKLLGSIAQFCRRRPEIILPS